MATLADLETALVNADKAGDTQAATVLAQEIVKARAAPRVQEPRMDPTAGMSGIEKGLAGAGKAFVDLGRGAGSIATDAFPGLASLGIPTRRDVDESKRLDAPLMDTGAGLAGNIIGNIAAIAPTALIPGANTIAGGAAIGGVAGALQPVGENDSRSSNIGINAAAGGAIPALIKGGKVAKAALIDPFTEAGRERIVGGALNRSVQDPKAVAAALRQATSSTPGFAPTAGQAGGDAGLASMERTARAIDPAGFGARDESQRAALVNALRSIAKTPEEKAAAEAARESLTKPLYDAAKNATVQGDDQLAALLQRPSMQAAQGKAAGLAAERGDKFMMSQGQTAKEVPTGILDASGRPIVNATPAQPPTLPGQSLHDLKMGLDQAIGSPGLGGLQGAERGAAMDTKSAYLQWLESKIPEYGQAREAYAAASKPINQMEVGQELYNRFVPALADTGGVPFKSRADALAQALRNGDQLTRNVTGMKGATLAGTMEPEQLALLQGVVKDAGMKATAETAGRGVGSDTAQKLSMSNLIAQAGVPSWMASVSRVPGGWLKTAGDILYTKNDDTMRHMLADILKDPQAAARAMEKAGVSKSKIGEFMRLATQGPAMALPAAVNAQQQ